MDPFGSCTSSQRCGAVAVNSALCSRNRVRSSPTPSLSDSSQTVRVMEDEEFKCLTKF